MGMEKIEVCTRCGGTGLIKVWEQGHNPDFEMVDCTTCNGTGRLIVHTYRYEVPFGTDNKKINEVDKKIVTAIREII